VLGCDHLAGPWPRVLMGLLFIRLGYRRLSDAVSHSDFGTNVTVRTPR
jgi:hypothetical protein